MQKIAIANSIWRKSLSMEKQKNIFYLPDPITSLAVKGRQGKKNQVLNHEKSQQIKVFLLKNL